MTNDEIRNIIAIQIWKYQECEEGYGDFNKVPDDGQDMPTMVKQMALDQAELIRVALVGFGVLPGGVQ